MSWWIPFVSLWLALANHCLPRDHSKYASEFTVRIVEATDVLADILDLPPLPSSPSIPSPALAPSYAVSEAHTPPSSGRSSLVYLTTPANDSTETFDIPILLLSTEETDTWQRSRKQPARNLSTSMSPSNACQRSSVELDSRNSLALPARENNWAGLKRTLSLGSTSSVSLRRANSRRPSRVAKTTSEVEVRVNRDKTSGPRQLCITVPPRPARSHSADDGRIKSSPRNLPPGPVPSGPSSPSSPQPLPSPLDQIKALARDFPQPPGRVVSGFSDIHDVHLEPEWISLDRVMDIDGKVFASMTVSPSIFKTKKISTREEESPTLPVVDLPHTPDDIHTDVTSSSSHTQSVYPPSPTLTPSPNLSITDKLILTTPQSPNKTQRDSVDVSYRRRFEGRDGEAGCHPFDCAEDRRSTPLSPRGLKIESTTASASASPRSSSSHTAIGDLVHSYATILPRGGKTMGQDWGSDTGTFQLICLSVINLCPVHL